jgi:type IV pilus assembly protein PilF
VSARNAWRVALAFVLASAVLASCAGPTADQKKEADARMRMGVTYIEQHNLPMAMQELTKASELDPANPEIDMAIGLAYRERGDLNLAEKYLRRAISKRPGYAAARNNLGTVLVAEHRWDDAIREFRAAANDVLYTTPEWAWYNMGEAYRSKGDPEKAEEAYRKAIRVNDRYEPAYLRLALVLESRGSWKEAAAVLQKLVELRPDDAPGWMELGRVYARLKRSTEATLAFDRVLTVSKDPEIRRQAAAYLKILRAGERR